MVKDMTKGSPMKLILGFSIPLLFGFLFQQFYNLVDTVIVGRFLGTDNLAAVGATGSVNFLIIGFCMGICSGFSIPVSHKFGAGDPVGMRRVVANCVWLTLGFALLMTVLTTVLGLVFMALATGMGAEMMQPIAVVCIGGLLYATLMTLFVVPAMYDIMAKKELRKVDL